jgi:predicted nucleotidyltransferase
MNILKHEKKAIEELKKILTKKYRLLDFRLFGSKATGTEVEGSDVDVMIVLSKTSPDIESQIDDFIFEINLKHECLITALYFSQEELESGPLAESPIYRKIQQQGIPL